MLRIKNLVIINGIAEFDYYVEDEQDRKGHIKFDIKNKKFIEILREKSDEQHDTYYHVNRAMRFFWEMLETGETERLFCFY